MKDLLKDILETSRDRIKTPITGSFALAFILWNWRPILILLLSDSSIEDKIKHINENYCDTSALLMPLIIALFYVLLVPYIMMALEWLTKIAIKGRKKNKHNLSLSDENNKQQIKRVIKRNNLTDLDLDIEIAGKQFELEQVRSGQRDISELNDKIASLNTQIDSINNQHKTQVENYEKVIEGYKENEVKNKAILDDAMSKKELSLKQSKPMLYVTNNIEETASLLSPALINEFIIFCDSRIYKINEDDPDFYASSIETFKTFLLIIEDKNGYSITPKGKAFYDFVKTEK